MENIKETVILNDEEMSKEKLQEAKDKLKESERITEVSPGEFRKLDRMNG